MIANITEEQILNFMTDPKNLPTEEDHNNFETILELLAKKCPAINSLAFQSLQVCAGDVVTALILMYATGMHVGAKLAEENLKPVDISKVN